MAYTAEERQQIAAQIRAYMHQGKIHSVIEAPEWIPVEGKDRPVLVEVIRTATTGDAGWLDVIARDVLCEIDHES